MSVSVIFIAYQAEPAWHSDWLPANSESKVLEVWPESQWPGFTLRQADVLQSYIAL